MRQVAKGGLTPLDATPSRTEEFSGDNEILMIYETFTSNNQRKRALREVNSIRGVAARGAWVDTPITFDHKDQPRSAPSRCPAALVLDPIVGSCRLRKVLMDGGSRLNLIYEDTLDNPYCFADKIRRDIFSLQSSEFGVQSSELIGQIASCNSEL
jgi:hypothetical protein